MVGTAMISAAAALCSRAAPRSLVPTWMEGSWAGHVTHSPLGALGTPADIEKWMVVSKPDESGNVYIRHSAENQLFRVQGSMMQYCFNYLNPAAPVTGSDTAPFLLDRADDESLVFCWRGERLPSHKANCTGCDCAQWTVARDGANLTSTFLQSPPAIHMKIALSRTRDPVPAASEVRGTWDCQFDNYTGFPNHTKSSGGEVTRKGVAAGGGGGCPFSAPEATAAAFAAKRAAAPAARIARADASGKVRNCLLVNHGAISQLEYVAEKLPCWPCKVTFTFTVPTPESGTYVAIGFKEVYAAYYAMDKMQDVNQYWGMSTSYSANQTELSGKIVVGYLDGTGGGCVRNMRATSYVGSLADADNETLIRDTSVSSASGYTILSFSAVIHAGEDEVDLAWQSDRGFGNQRIMFASGSVGGDQSCSSSASVGYHDGNRGVGSLNFPSFAGPCQ